MPLWDESAKMAHFAISLQNGIYYFRWAAVLIVVTKPLLGEIININYGNSLGHTTVWVNKNGCNVAKQLPKTQNMLLVMSNSKIAWRGNVVTFHTVLKVKSEEKIDGR